MINFLKFILSKINIAQAISILALIISMGGLGISAWNISISESLYTHKLKIYQKEEDKNFEQIKLKFLMEIADDLEDMYGYFIEIYKIRARFKDEPETVKDSMKSFLPEFNYYNNAVMLSLAKLNFEWESAISYSNKNYYQKLIIDKANFYKNFKTNIVLKKSIQNNINNFNKYLEKYEQKNNVHSDNSAGVLAAKIFSPEVSEIPVYNDPVASSQNNKAQ